MRNRRWITVCSFAGVALGAAAAGANSVPSLLGEAGESRAHRSDLAQAAEFVSLILDSGWAWAATAAAVGWLVSKGMRPVAGALTGALAGCIALIGATITYYCGELLFQGAFSWDWRVQFWLIATLVLGAPLGAVGSAIRRPGPVGALAALVVPAGAVLNMVLLPPPSESPVADLVTLTVWAAAATATVVVLTHTVRTRRRGGRDSRPVADLANSRT